MAGVPTSFIARAATSSTNRLTAALGKSALQNICKSDQRRFKSESRTASEPVVSKASLGGSTGARKTLPGVFDVKADQWKLPCFPEIPLSYYKATHASMHSIEHRGFYINWFFVMVGMDILRHILDNHTDM